MPESLTVATILGPLAPCRGVNVPPRPILITDEIKRLRSKLNTELKCTRLICHIPTHGDTRRERTEKIELRQGDDPEEVARDFCYAHGLSDVVLEALQQHMVENVRKVHQAQASNSPQTASHGEPSVGQQRAPDTGGSYTSAVRSLNPPSASNSPLLPADSTSGHSHGHLAPEWSVLPQAGQAAHRYETGEALSFSEPMSDRMQKQLSAKLMPVVSEVPDFMGGKQQGRGKQGRKSSSGAANATVRSSMQSSKSSASNQVYNRLYHSAEERRRRIELARMKADAEEVEALKQSRTSMSWISAEIMKQRSQGHFENYGEMLYAEGIEAAATKRSKADAARAEIEERELEGATWTPQITSLAQEIWIHRPASAGGGAGHMRSSTAWQRLSTLGPVRRNRALEVAEESKRQKEMVDEAECTFQPKINRSSAVMMAERSHTLKMLQMSAHEQLFQDATRRRQKMEELSKWCPDDATFQPQVNKRSTAVEYMKRSFEGGSEGLDVGSTADPGSLPSAANPPPVINRLYASYNKTKAKLEDAREKYHGSHDPTTGRLLYHPEVGRAPRNRPSAKQPVGQHSPSGAPPVFEHLYSSAEETRAKKEAMKEAERKQAEAQASQSHSTSTSNRLYNRLKLKRFTQVFEYLDEHKTGLIDLVELVLSPTARVDNLDNEVRKDVELAAELHASQSNKQTADIEAHSHTDIHRTVPMILLLTVQVREDVELAAELHASQSNEQTADANPGSDQSPPTTLHMDPINLEHFMALMEAALGLRRGPRSYLVPSPSGKQAESFSFRPSINQRSKALASRLRPPENAENLRTKLAARRQEKEEGVLAGCTFEPQLNPNRSGVESRVYRPSSAGPSTASTSHHTGTGMGGHGEDGLPAGPHPAAGGYGQSRQKASVDGSPSPAAGGYGQSRQKTAVGGSRSASVASEGEQLLALELEVQDALTRVSQATHQLEGISSSSPRGGAPSAQGASLPDQLSALLGSQVDADGQPEDIAVTEELLKELLAASDGVELNDETSLMQRLHHYLLQAADQTQTQPAANIQSSPPLSKIPPPTGGVPTGHSAVGGGKAQARTSKAEPPAGAGAPQSISRMEELAQQLENWDCSPTDSAVQSLNAQFNAVAIR
eukprot:gene2715-12588_t